MNSLNKDNISKTEWRKKSFHKTTYEFNMLLTNIFFLQAFKEKINLLESFWSKNEITKNLPKQ